MAISDFVDEYAQRDSASLRLFYSAAAALRRPRRTQWLLLLEYEARLCFFTSRICYDGRPFERLPIFRDFQGHPFDSGGGFEKLYLNGSGIGKPAFHGIRLVGIDHSIGVAIEAGMDREIR